MPVALKADWNFAKVLYVQGLPIDEVAEKIGVNPLSLKTRIRRQKWSQLRRESQSIVTQSVATNSSFRSLSQRTKSIREKLTNDVEKAVDAFCDNPKFDPRKSKSLRAIALRESVASQIQKRAWATLGLDAASASGTVVNIAVMSAASDAEQPEQASLPGPAVDVEKASE